MNALRAHSQLHLSHHAGFDLIQSDFTMSALCSVLSHVIWVPAAICGAVAVRVSASGCG